MPELIFKSPDFKGQSCQLPDGDHSVGSAAGNQIQIVDSSVSGKHCRILVYVNEVIVREAGSKNGVFVEGRKVEAQMGIKHQQILQIGKVEALLALDVDCDDGESAMTALDDLRKDLRIAGDNAEREGQLLMIFRAVN
jgi:pSer/pThr/pTyr-binding forkhead associated (FHA) protein